MRNALAIKSETDAALTLEGWAVVFDTATSPGADLSGEYFSADTNFWLDQLGAVKMALYDHGQNDAVKSAVLGSGTLERKTVDSVEGLWFTAELDKSVAYVKQVAKLAKKSLLGASTGAVSHLVERVDDADADSDRTWIKSWPIAEVSFLVTPCEPRTIGFESLKALIDKGEAARATIEAAPTLPAGRDLKSTSYEQIRDQVSRVINRSDSSPFDLADADWSSIVGTFPDHVIVERVDYDADGDGGLWKIGYTVDAAGVVTLGTAEQVTTEYPAITKSLVKHAAALKALLPPETSAATKQTTPLEASEPATPEEPEMSQAILDAIKALSDDLKATNTRMDGIAVIAEEPAVKTAGVAVPAVIIAKPGSADQAEAEFKSFLGGGPYPRSAFKAALNEGTNSQGGYAVPAKYSNDLVTPLTDLSFLRLAGARIIKLEGTDAFHIPALTFASAAVLTAEAAAYTEGEPTMAETLFAPWKLTRLAKVSEELAADSRFDLWGQILLPDYAQSFAAAENSYFTTGTGTSQPAGVVTGAPTGITLATGNTLLIPADSVIDTYFSLDYKYRANAVWMMNDATLKVVRKLKDSQNRYLFEPNYFAPGNGIGTAQGPDGVRSSGTILGKPVITNNSMAVPAANAKTILFGDFSYYWIADWAGLEMQRLSELYAANGQVGFRAFHRTDAHLMLQAAMTLMVQSAT